MNAPGAYLARWYPPSGPVILCEGASDCDETIVAVAHVLVRAGVMMPFHYCAKHAQESGWDGSYER